MATYKNLHIIDHPLVQDRLSRIRDQNTNSHDFRRYIKDIGMIMAVEATKGLGLQPRTIKTPVSEMKANFLKNKEPVIVPILRAGLGLSEGVQQVLTEADVGHIGVYRDEDTKRPVEYLVKLPSDIAQRDVIVVDPMLATGHSAEHALDILVQSGVEKNRLSLMVLVAAPEGVKQLQSKYSDVPIYAASLDEKLNQDCYIVPGLGDAGDRIFGTE